MQTVLKVCLTTLAILITVGIINFIQNGETESILKVLPFVGGEINAYDWGSLVLLVLLWWGISRLRRQGKSDE